MELESIKSTSVLKREEEGLKREEEGLNDPTECIIK